jgi:hypothetical protein
VQLVVKKIFHFSIVLFLLFVSCGKQDESLKLPIEKLYIVEFRFSLPDEDYESSFRVVGFSELDKDFHLKNTFQSAPNYYSTSNVILDDSLKNKVSDIINHYPTDTTFFYPGNTEDRMYCGNSYMFVFQKNDSSHIQIYFYPEFLPGDLSFLYACLYENGHRFEQRAKYTELFDKFENIIRTDSNIVPPPPLLKETIQFTPPVIKTDTKR